MRQDQPVPTRRFSFTLVLLFSFFSLPAHQVFAILRFLFSSSPPTTFFTSFSRSRSSAAACQRQPDILSPPLPHFPAPPNLCFSTAYRLPHVSPSRHGTFARRGREREIDLRPRGDGTHGRSLSDCQWCCLPVCGAQTGLPPAASGSERKVQFFDCEGWRCYLRGRHTPNHGNAPHGCRVDAAVLAEPVKHCSLEIVEFACRFIY